MTLQELEQACFTDNLEFKDEHLKPTEIYDSLFGPLEKPLQPLSELEQAISQATNNYTKPFHLEKVSAFWKYTVGLLIPEHRIEEWFNDKTRYKPLSPLDKLSSLDPAQFKKDCLEVVNTFHEAFGFASMPPYPTQEQMFYITRLAQYEQLVK